MKTYSFAKHIRRTVAALAAAALLPALAFANPETPEKPADVRGYPLFPSVTMRSDFNSDIWRIRDLPRGSYKLFGKRAGQWEYLGDHEQTSLLGARDEFRWFLDRGYSEVELVPDRPVAAVR